MPDHAAGRNSVLRLQVRDQLLDGLQLRGRGWFLFKIADQGDPDSVLVVIGAAGVGTVHLLFPAEGRFNLTVTHSVAVADDEVVADPQPVVSFRIFTGQMRLVNAFHTARVCGRMVNDDRRPVACFSVWCPRTPGNGWPGNLGAHLWPGAANRGSRRQDQRGVVLSYATRDGGRLPSLETATTATKQNMSDPFRSTAVLLDSLVEQPACDDQSADILQ